MRLLVTIAVPHAVVARWVMIAILILYITVIVLALWREWRR